MAEVYVFLADGFEDIEALAPVDILRRGGVEVKTVSIMHRTTVISAHQVPVVADLLFGDEDMSGAQLLVLPGGMPGAANLNAHKKLGDLLVKQNKRGALIAAICAAPMVLGSLGLLKGKRATCYPGFESAMEGATYTATLVEQDGNIITGEGPAAALPFGYRLLLLLKDDDTVKQLQDGMMYTHLMA